MKIISKITEAWVTQWSHCAMLQCLHSGFHMLIPIISKITASAPLFRSALKLYASFLGSFTICPLRFTEIYPVALVKTYINLHPRAKESWLFWIKVEIFQNQKMALLSGCMQLKWKWKYENIFDWNIHILLKYISLHCTITSWITNHIVELVVTLQ